MRHRKGSAEKTLQSRPLACAVLGMIQAFIDLLPALLIVLSWHS